MGQFKFRSAHYGLTGQWYFGSAMAQVGSSWVRLNLGHLMIGQPRLSCKMKQTLAKKALVGFNCVKSSQFKFEVNFDCVYFGLGICMNVSDRKSVV